MTPTMTPSRFWPFDGPRAGVAFSESLLVTVGYGQQGAERVTELPEQLLQPSPSLPNVRSVAELARLVAESIEALGARPALVAVALPDLALTTAVLDATGRLGDADQLRRLASRLTYPASEARADFWRSGGDRVLGAAVREAVIRQYEQVLDAAEVRIGWVDGASTARIPAWAAKAAPDDALRAWVQLYRSHYAIVVLRGRALLDLRWKLRSQGDGEAVARELARLPSVYQAPRFEALTLSGEDAGLTAEALETERPELRPVGVEEEGEVRQMRASLDALFARGRHVS